MLENEPAPAARFDMKLPFWAIVVALLAAIGAYYGQREATSIALTEMRGELVAVKASLARIETDRYTGSDARRDFAWRDERTVEFGRRLAEVEQDLRRRR
jgi:hypothetical protein